MSCSSGCASARPAGSSNRPPSPAPTEVACCGGSASVGLVLDSAGPVLMTIAEDVESRPMLAVPPRPPRPLSTLQMLRVGFSNTLAACDEELFDELFVERRYVWGRLFVVSDPDGIKRVLQDNVDNYPRIDAIRRVFAFGSGSGMLCAEGEVWRRHRRLLNPTLDHRAVRADVPGLTALAEELAQLLGEVPRGQP